MRDSDPANWAADEWTFPVLAPLGGGYGGQFGYSQAIENAVENNAAIDWQGATDLIEEPWFSSVVYAMKRRIQLPAINAVVYIKVLPLLGYMAPLAQTHPISRAVTWSQNTWLELGTRTLGSKQGSIKHVAPVSAEGWGKLANAIIATVKDEAQNISQPNRAKLMKIADACLAAMDQCVTLSETVANNTGLRPALVQSWRFYRQVNILVGLGDPGDAQGALGGDRDLSGKKGPWLLRNMKWIAPLALLAAGGFYVAPILAPLFNVAGKARSRATRETKRLESRATPILDSDERTP